MGAFIDARCVKCDKKIGWFGKATDHPACPRCGHKPDLKSLEEDERKMEEFADLLVKSRAHRLRGEELRKMRKLAGLTLVHVFEKTGITMTDLSRFERGEAEPAAEQAKMLNDLYAGLENPNE